MYLNERHFKAPAKPEQLNIAAAVGPSNALQASQGQPHHDSQQPTMPLAGDAERQQLLREQRVYEREVLRAEQEQRTREFVDSMWQSLE